MALAVWPLAIEEAAGRCCDHRLEGSVDTCYTWKLEAIAVAVAEPRRNDNIFEASNEEAAA